MLIVFVPFIVVTSWIGVGIIVASTAVVIAINTIRGEIENEEFAQFYGRMMLVMVAVLIVAANIALPVCAYF